jgi:hypothetical protein
MLRALSLLLAVVLSFSAARFAQASTVTFRWDPNTEPDLAGYRLYYGNSPRNQTAYTQTVPINNRNATTWELSLPAGVYYFALTAFDLSGNESGFSTEVRAEVPDSTSPPGKPGRPIFIP